METIQNISIIFLSILLEAIPFILLGVILSSLIEKYVPKEFIAKLIPKNPILGSFVGVLLGFFVPACDCAVIPIAIRLIKKGVPLHVAITFMLSSPIINPIVLISTTYAFGYISPEMFYYRTIFGILIAIVAGILIHWTTKKDQILSKKQEMSCNHDCNCSHEHHHKEDKSFFGLMSHIVFEFMDIFKFLVFGALLASLIQVLLPREVLLSLNNLGPISILVLMVFAYFLSLCSTSDSFVGKTLLNSFENNAVLGFLLLGPMIDLKNTILLFGMFHRKLVLKLIIILFILVLITSTLLPF